jgi:hypothetical protein
MGLFLEFSPTTTNHALVLLSRVNAFGQYERQQLLSLICISLASKLFESKFAGFNTLHRMSCHSFTNQDLCACESRVLALLDYDLARPEALLTHRLRVTFLLIAPLYPPPCRPAMDSILDALSWLMLEDPAFIAEFEDTRVLVAGLILAATILGTGHTGRFPATWRLSTLHLLPEDKLNHAARKVLKRVLGK